MENESVIIEVSMGDMKISSAPGILVTRGLGSCLGIVIYDSIKKTGGLAHPMLPLCSDFKGRGEPSKYVDTVIDMMLEKLSKTGCKEINLTAKLFGGAHMFSSIPLDGPFNIGGKNVKAAREKLAACGIKIIAEDVGSNYGRTVFLHLETGIVELKTAFSGKKEV